MSRPRVLLFTGEGKGKTTAALGMAMRASGHGQRTRVLQFLKSDARTGELAAARFLPGVEVVQTGLGFVPPPTHPEFDDHRRRAHQGLDLAAAAIDSGEYDLVILDEICTAVSRQLITEERVLQTLSRAREGLCLVLTGRGASDGLVAFADTVTEMRCVKHGYRAGWAAQKGVEF